MRRELTQARLRELLHYDPETGDFRHNCRKQGCHVGDMAGSILKTGYWCVSVDNRIYRAHRLAWFYMTGEWPKADVDHKNCDRLDNRWENLREATRSQNNGNRAVKAGHPFKGASYYPKRGRWLAKIAFGGEQIYLGWYDTGEEAHAAYVAAAAKYFGEFARAA